MPSVRKDAMKLVGRLSVQHPGHGEPSYAYLMVDRGLKSGKLDEVRLTEDQLLDLVRDGASACRLLLRPTPPTQGYRS